MRSTEQLRAFVRTNNSQMRRRRLVLAASGGADSAAMVALLCDTHSVAPGDVVVAHFDHRLRGRDEARRDLRVVQALCARYGLELVLGEWDSPRCGEAHARHARYRFLATVAAQRNADVVTGHTQDDQIETIVMRMLRGAGTPGMCGMAPDAPLPAGGSSARLWRPLLDITREETRAYCAETGVEFHDDHTNDDKRLLRNRVRLVEIPRLERTFGPRFREELLSSIAKSRALTKSMDAWAASSIEHLPGLDVKAVRVAMTNIMVSPMLGKDYAGHIIRQAIGAVLGNTRDITRRHIDPLADSSNWRRGAVWRLPRGAVAIVRSQHLVIASGMPRAPVIPDAFAHELPFDAPVGAWNLAVRRGAPRPGEQRVWLPAGCVVRRRRPGDRLRPRGLGGRRRLQDVLVDAHAPAGLRDALPVIARGSDVWWAPYGPPAEPPVDAEEYAIRAVRTLPEEAFA